MSAYVPAAVRSAGQAAAMRQANRATIRRRESARLARVRRQLAGLTPPQIAFQDGYRIGQWDPTGYTRKWYETGDEEVWYLAGWRAARAELRVQAERACGRPAPVRPELPVPLEKAT